MTDAWLMEANCIHGEVWYKCIECDELIKQELSFQEQLEDE